MNKIMSCIIATVIIFSNFPIVQSAEKRDVTDPVLREMIASLSSTMPRFIDKYGATVFVSDEQITRSELLKAIYEYDKKSKPVAQTEEVGFVTKEDFSLLKTRVSSLEKKSLGTAKAGTGSVNSNLDIIQVMNDLEPNMPMLLDNSLQNSKVFKDLEKKVNSKAVVTAGVSGSSGISSTELESIKTDINNLNQKYASLSTSLSSANNSKMSSTQVTANISLLKKDIADINTKLSTLQNNVTTLSSAKNFETKSVQQTELKKNISDINIKLASLQENVTALSLAKNSSSGTTKGIQQTELKKLNEEIDSLKKSVVQTQRSYVDVAKRVNTLEDKPTIVASSNSNVSSAQIGYLESQISKSNSKTSTDIKKIESRLSSLEKSSKSSRSSSSSNSSTSSSSSTGSTIAKISLGLTLVAALFIAR